MSIIKISNMSVSNLRQHKYFEYSKSPLLPQINEDFSCLALLMMLLTVPYP